MSNDWARWAKRRADVYGACGEPGSTVRSVEYKVGRVDGATDAFDALLSDEAVEAAAELFYTMQTGTVGKYRTSIYKGAWDASARAALQAAVYAVTNPESSDSGSTEEKNND